MQLIVLLVLTIELFGQADSDAIKGDFFIVSSVDVTKKQILLKRPTEVTELMRFDAGTRYYDEHAKPIRFTDLRAGDTVFITSKAAGAQSLALTIRKGPMTVDVLRERYLNRPK